MRIGARDFMEETRVKEFRPHWIDDVAMLIVPPWFLVIAFALPAASSNWARAAFITGAVLLTAGARARLAVRGYACATLAGSGRGRDGIGPRTESYMKTGAGLWIDHRKAVLAVTGPRETADKMTDRQLVADLNTEIAKAEAEGASRKRAENAAASKAQKILMERLTRIPIAVDEGISRWEGEGGPAAL